MKKEILTNYTFTVPAGYGSRVELFKRELLVVAGGFVASPASGGWVSPRGEHVLENVIMFNVATTPHKATAVLRLMKQHFPQEESFYWAITGHASIVPGTKKVSYAA